MVSRTKYILCIVVLFLTDFIQKIENVFVIKCECGIANDSLEANRIVGGRITTPHKYPWLVYITLNGNLHCGGTLINNRYVLSAGHCVKWFNKKNLGVVLGRHDQYSKTGLHVGVTDVKIHFGFTSDAVHDTNDIALIKLSRSVNFTRNISPVCLPHPLSDHTNHIGVVVGWGKTAQSGRASRFAREATVKIMADNYCLSSPIGHHYSDSMMCAYALNVDACQGDSGGPLLFERRPSKFEIMGIVSWGLGCAKPDIPGVYTKVVNFMQWIADNTKDAVYCEIN